MTSWWQRIKKAFVGPDNVILLPASADVASTRRRIKIQQGSEIWMVVHKPSKATVRKARMRTIQTLCRPVAFALTFIAITLVIQGFRLTPAPGTRYVGGGIVLLACAAWLAWSIQVPVPREDKK